MVTTLTTWLDATALFDILRSVLIEVYPIAYMDYSFRLMAETCRVWYFEMASQVFESKLNWFQWEYLVDFAAFAWMRLKLTLICSIWWRWYSDDTERYETDCGKLVPHRYAKCNQVKTRTVWVNVSDAVKLVRHSLELIGYDTKSWLSDIYHPQSNGESASSMS